MRRSRPDAHLSDDPRLRVRTADTDADPDTANELTRRSASLLRTAEDLEAAAKLWRSADLV